MIIMMGVPLDFLPTRYVYWSIIIKPVYLPVVFTQSHEILHNDIIGEDQVQTKIYVRGDSRGIYTRCTMKMIQVMMTFMT